MVTTTDLVADTPADVPVAQIMTRDVLTVPRYADVHVAARVMRNHHVHHLVVTHEHRVVGIVSSFDLLRLVEDHRFVMKNGPTESTRRPPRRG
jgi:signal-transduction protein with cAMP-binding, CBS, and nucleotidyltransferase domain